MPRPGFMSYAVVMRLLTMSVIWLLLLVWVFNAHRSGCAVGAALLALFSAVIFIAANERSQLLRRALWGETTQADGWLFRMVYNRVLITIRDLLGAVALAVVLLASAVTFSPQHWSILFADLLLLTLLLPRLMRALGGEVRPEYRYAMARQQALWISALLLWVQTAAMQVFYPSADFTGMRWQEVVTYNLTMPEVGCAALDAAARILVTGQAIAMWAMQNGARVAKDPTQSAMLWVGYTTLVGFTFLTALAYSRALIGVMSRPWEMWGTTARTDAEARHNAGAGEAV